MKYEVVMGLEVHVELSAESKLFCSCSAMYGAGPNENVCPACAGMPGFLPVANRRAVELGIAAGIVTEGEITRTITFDKKNYFYPDLPTGYQITQLFAPVCRNGKVEIQTSGGKKTITIKQIHIEEDAGKLVHDNRTGESLADFNRGGVPLVEIVSNPDFRSAEEVTVYLERLRLLLTFAGISDCKMHEGSMRADVNISVREEGVKEYGTRVEIKNLNSIRAINRAIAYESGRHIDALKTGFEGIVQETRRWDDDRGVTYSMRSKEDATDYRYFPNPDIPPITITDEMIEAVRASLPEPAHEKYARLTRQYALSDYDARIISSSRRLCAIFDEVMTAYGNAKDAANWITVDLLAIAKGETESYDDISIDTAKFSRLIALVADKAVNRGVGRTILAEIYKNGADPDEYIKSHGVGMVSDEELVRSAVGEVIAENADSVDKYKRGHEKVYAFLVGKVMAKLRGKADPDTVNAVLKEMLK